MLAKVEQLAKQLDAETAAASPKGDDGEKPQGDTPTSKPTGRRDLAKSDLPVVRIEVTDPELEGKVERVGFEESSRFAWERGGPRRVVVARVKYRVVSDDAADATRAQSTDDGATAAQIVTTPMPKELFRRCLLAPSMIAHVIVAKYLLGVPFYRLEQSLELQGISLDRGTMCRYAEDVGATLGAIVEAARAEAFANAYCLSTDATGVSIQRGALRDRERGPCRKGHFFVVLADRDHVFFEYQEKHTSAAVCEMFKGFSGYIQADAHAVYDALFRDALPRGQPPDAVTVPKEVGCWSHCRRYFWEAAVCKHALGVDGMIGSARVRISRGFDAALFAEVVSALGRTSR
jgi:hypothetical protein